MTASTKEMHSICEIEAVSESKKTKISSISQGLEMRITGAPPYSVRLAAYLAGDRTQVVRAEFADVVEGIGKRKIDFEKLTKQEKRALCGTDTRWQRGPDGVLLWEPVSLQDGGYKSNPNFTNLLKDAQVVLNQQIPSPVFTAAGEGDTDYPEWLENWVQVWSYWGYRFTSIRYDQALESAKAKNSKSILAGAGVTVSRLTKSILEFFLGYLSQSTVTELFHGFKDKNDTSWLLPEDFLDSANHGQANELRDDFWIRCCMPHETKPRGQDSASITNRIGSTLSLDVQIFLDFVVVNLNACSTDSRHFRNPLQPRNCNGTLLVPSSRMTTANESKEADNFDVCYETPVARMSDQSCSWISRDYPHLRAWEPYAREYIQDTKKGVTAALVGLSVLFERYLSKAGVPGTPGELLDRDCAKRPIADEFGCDAFLQIANKDKVPKSLDLISDSHNVAHLRTIRDGFLPHILTRHCSLVDEEGVTILTTHWNPFSSIELEDRPNSIAHETVRPAMPYIWIRGLRRILVQGAHFCDWSWAQQVQQSERGNSADWFEVDESIIDKTDPDCVWRVRTTGHQKASMERTFFEIWSPVRWIVLLTKLNTALRTMQVRTLDSGESDELIFDLRQWAIHSYCKATGSNNALQTPSRSPDLPLNSLSATPWVLNDIKSENLILYDSIKAQESVRNMGRKRDPHGWMNGVLRPISVHDPAADQRQLTTVLYINTNKTADARKEGAAKGFEAALPIHKCPLPPDEAYWVRRGEHESSMERIFPSQRHKDDWLDELGENIHWWLAKLRDWQKKYNPIDRRVEWKELSGTGLIGEKSDEQYEMYRPACFLMREPAMNKSKNHPGPSYPLPDSVVSVAWWHLLKEFQNQLNSEVSEGQSEYRLVTDDTGVSKACVYDLHSIRVSIITALIVDGKVPIQYIQKLVGHSRLIMTIYYTKLNPLTMMREIEAGFARVTESEVESQKLFIQNASVDELRTQLAFNDPESALAALGASCPPGSRNMVIWLRKLGGICPVGGASHDTEGGLVAGCFNGGPLINGSGKKTRYAPVEGGPGTCVNCRWFVTKLPFIGELQAIAENALYRLHEFKEKTFSQEKTIEKIKIAFERQEAEQGTLSSNQKFQMNLELESAEAIRDGFIESAAQDVMISINAFGLIQRLVTAHSTPDSDLDGALVAKGAEDEIKIILEQTDSAMLHAARVCLHSEIHPEINAPAASLRVAMTIARKLQEEELDPFSLLSLPEEVQTRAVNAVTQHIASLCEPNNSNIGLSKAAALLESKYKLSEITRTPPIKLREWVSGLTDGITALPTLEAHGREGVCIRG
jgi:hypothetical protein